MTEDGAQEVAQALAVGVLDKSITMAEARAVTEILMGGILPTISLRQRKLGGTQTSRQLQVQVSHKDLLLQITVDDGALVGQQVRQIIDGEVA